MSQPREMEKIPVCKCASCGRIIDFCTRDNPCPVCGNSIFTVEYEAKEQSEK